MGIDKIDNLCHEQNMNQANISLLPLWRSLGNTGDLPTGWNGPGGSSSNPNMTGVTPAPTQADLLAAAKALNDQQISYNQPAINTLGSQMPMMQQQYGSLLQSITGMSQNAVAQGSVAVNSQTLATNNELGARGIAPGAGLYDNTMAQSLLPVTTANQGVQNQFANLYATTGLSEQSDINAIANQIAALQAGNFPQAQTTASSLSGAQTNASATEYSAQQQLQAAIAQSNAQIQASQNQANAAIQAARINNQYQQVTAGNSLVNVAGNSGITPALLAQLQKSGYFTY